MDDGDRYVCLLVKVILRSLVWKGVDRYFD